MAMGAVTAMTLNPSLMNYRVTLSLLLDLEQLEVYHNSYEPVTGSLPDGPGTLALSRQVCPPSSSVTCARRRRSDPESAGADDPRAGTAGRKCYGNRSTDGREQHRHGVHELPGTVTTLTFPWLSSVPQSTSINPCAFSVLIILLLSIIALQSRRQVLMVGITLSHRCFCSSYRGSASSPLCMYRWIS